MRDIPYTSKLDHAEDGRPLALDYFILVRDGEPEQYGIKVIEKNSGAQALAFDLTTEPERIYTLADKLSRNRALLPPLCWTLWTIGFSRR